MKKTNQNRFLQNKYKFGFIFLHDNSSTYDYNFIQSAEKVCNELNVEPVFRPNIPEGEECYKAAKELVDEGCIGIFADSFGHEDYLIKAAKEFPNVQFAQSTGTKAHTEKLSNFHNAFASIYEGRYITGIAAGMKLNEMIDNKIIKKEEAKVGYIGAFPYAEVVSGYTAFFLGIRSVCDFANMTVRYTNSWYDEEGEAKVAKLLIDEDKCKIISQHADSQGAPKVCEEKEVPNIFYNMENKELTKSYLISSKINWDVYFRYFITNTINNSTMDYDWTGNLADGSVHIFPPSSLSAPNTQDAINEAVNKLKEGNIHVFNTSSFTVRGSQINTYKADVDTDAKNEGDTEVISDGYFHESEKRSAPYFDLRIDGITEIEDDPTKFINESKSNIINISMFFTFLLSLLFLY